MHWLRHRLRSIITRRRPMPVLKSFLFLLNWRWEVPSSTCSCVSAHFGESNWCNLSQLVGIIDKESCCQTEKTIINCVWNDFFQDLTYFVWLGRREFWGKGGIKGGRRKPLNLLFEKGDFKSLQALIWYIILYCARIQFKRYQSKSFYSVSVHCNEW